MSSIIPNQKTHEMSLEHSSEYVEFINKLAVYHQKRGTYFDPEPKVGTKHMNLLRLYKAVIERGGYDVVSDEKLAWRKVGQEFNLGSSNLPAVAFQLKGVYYKYLAAYEISNHWGEEPPPREILEDLTARGGGLRTRTVQNFAPPGKRDGGANDFSEASGDDGTPSRERNVSEDTPGSGGRATRGLRQQPPQRIIFQPDTGPARQSRNMSSTSHPPLQQQSHNQLIQQQQIVPTPRGASTSYIPANNPETSLAVTNYEPRSQTPLTLRPITTPGNNQSEFAKRQRLLREKRLILNSGKPRRQDKGVILPGSGFDGPNIYVRCLCALRSGIQSEQDYALHHLVKISMERGDKYRFEGFPGLAEGLIEKLLEVSSLFYDVEWKVNYLDDENTNMDTLNALDGTSDIIERISQLLKKPVDDNIQSIEFSDRMLQINEAALTLRNMVMLEENAMYVSELPLIQDFLCIALNLPNLDSVVELKHYALDMAEQITKYLHLGEKNPLFVSLLGQLYSEDRGAILTTLRAISRISMNLEENNLLRGVPIDIIQRIMDWILLNDEDLVSICLDFLYQYTAVVDNVESMLSGDNMEYLVNHLVRFLLYDSKTVESEVPTDSEHRVPAPTAIAPIPQELFTELVSMEEPDRSSLWLRCLFEEDVTESITQIALWQAYQSCFTSSVQESGIPLLPAAEFIKNVSTTFADKAAAQVQSGAVQKFIIKGIRYRSVPINSKGEKFRKCCWTDPSRIAQPCGQFFLSPQSMYKHVLTTHLGAIQVEDGRFKNSDEHQFNCCWDNCQRFSTEPATKLSQIASHIKVHLPPCTSASNSSTSSTLTSDNPDNIAQQLAKRQQQSYILPKRQKFTHNVTVDEKQDTAGIPLTAILILRNLARNLPKIEANETIVKSSGESVPWVERLFKPIEPQLFDIMTHNKSLTLYMIDLLNSIKGN